MQQLNEGRKERKKEGMKVNNVIIYESI